MEAVFSPTFVDAVASIVDLHNRVAESVRETRLACFNADRETPAEAERRQHEINAFYGLEDECEQCGKPILLGPCSDFDCPLDEGDGE